MKTMAYVFMVYGMGEKTKIYHQEDIQLLFEATAKATEDGVSFAVYELGKCVGDFS